MINVIQTLKNLNREFPRYQLDTLIKIVECICDEPILNTTACTDWSKVEPWINYKVTCDTPNTFVYNTTTKNHAVDKTSARQAILSDGENAEDDLNLRSTITSMEDLAELLKQTYATKCPIEE